MRYRIKEEIYNDHSKYYAQVKGKLFGWNNIDNDGIEWLSDFYYLSRNDAIDAINKHKKNNSKNIEIKYEYYS